IHGLHCRSAGISRWACRCFDAAARMTEISTAQPASARAGWFGSATLGHVLPFLILLVIGLALPLFAGGYWGVIAQRACVYWVLVAGGQPPVGVCRPHAARV